MKKYKVKIAIALMCLTVICVGGYIYLQNSGYCIVNLKKYDQNYFFEKAFKHRAKGYGISWTAYPQKGKHDWETSAPLRGTLKTVEELIETFEDCCNYKFTKIAIVNEFFFPVHLVTFYLGIQEYYEAMDNCGRKIRLIATGLSSGYNNPPKRIR